jgi:hypothetical protein
MNPLNKPQREGKYRDRDIDCQEALEKAFMEIAGAQTNTVIAAAGGTMSPALAALAKRAEAVGWSLEEAEVAISELAQNILDDAAAEEEE